MTLTSHEESQPPSSYCIQVRAKKSRNIIAAHLVYLISSLPSCLGSGYSVPDLAPPEEVDRTYVNIREFMRPHSQYIWTTLGTLRDECVTCKVEKVLNVTNLTVEFLRYHNVDHLRVRRHYKGNFGFKQQIPILMELTVIKEEIIINNTKWTVPLKLEGHTEVLIYAEANQSCGVFLNKARTFSTLPNGDVHIIKEGDYTSCELRVKSFSTHPVPTENCLKSFKMDCPVGPYFTVYQKDCLMPTFEDETDDEEASEPTSLSFTASSVFNSELTMVPDENSTNSSETTLSFNEEVYPFVL